MTDDDDNVPKLPVRFKNPLPDDRSVLMLHEVPRAAKCSHWMVQYIVDASAAEVECGKCGAKLNPMWVLTQLASNDRRMNDSQERYQEEMKRLDERSKTKCFNCGKMTRISRR